MPPYIKKQESDVFDDGWIIADGACEIIAHLDTEGMADALLHSLLGGASRPPGYKTDIPIKKPKADKYVLLYVYCDGDDEPLVIKNPPRNLRKLLDEWNALDQRMCEELNGGQRGPATEEWEYVSKWLKNKGVDVIEPDDTLSL